MRVPTRVFAELVDLPVNKLVDPRVYKFVQRGGFLFLLQKMPGIAVFLIEAGEGHFLAFRIEEDQTTRSEFFDGNEVPGIQWRDERSDDDA